jgi:ribonuclease G
MAKEIVVNARTDQTRIAIVEEGDLAELYIENPEHKRTIGNLVLGRVRKVMPSIRAAFVDVGQPSDAFLHFSDVADNLPEALDFLRMDPPDASEVALPGQSENGSGGDDQKAGKRHRRKGFDPEDVLENGQHILVKISKEPIADKGSRVSTDLSLAGRFLVLVPLTEFVAVSKKISNPKERRRLKTLTSSLLPRGFGAIVRTVAEGRDAETLDQDLGLLVDHWRELEEHLSEKPQAPVTLYEDVDMVSSIIRDEFSSDYRRILIDNPNLYRSIRSYVEAVAPETESSVLLHTGDDSVFEEAGIQEQVDRAFERRVELPSGGYLFIERTEAMHVIDVNSGRSGEGKSQEKNSVDVNLEAARVIANQTRLRDLGGILVVDFIDLRKDKNRKKVYDEMKKEFSRDRAVTKILPMSDFGLVQVTRQRLRPSITTSFSPEGFEDEAPAGGEDDGTEDRASSIADEAGGPMSAAHREELGHLRREVARLKNELEAPREKAQDLKEDMRAAREEREKLESRLRRFKEQARRHKQTAEERKEELEALREEKRALSKEVDERAKEARRQFTGEGVPPEHLSETLDRWLADYADASDGQPLRLRVHPYAAAYLARSVPSHPARWFSRHFVRVRLAEDEELAPLDFRFEDLRTGRDLTEARGRLDEARPDTTSADAETEAGEKADEEADSGNAEPESHAEEDSASGNAAVGQPASDGAPDKGGAPEQQEDDDRGINGRGGPRRRSAGRDGTPGSNAAGSGEGDAEKTEEAVGA